MSDTMRLLVCFLLLPVLCLAQPPLLDLLPDEIPFAPGEMRPHTLMLHEPDDPQPQTDYTQTIQLHEGWNLVSWHIWPSGTAGISEQIRNMIPETGWISDNPGGEVFYYDNSEHSWPAYDDIGDVWWYVDWAFYFNMNGYYTWEYQNKPEVWPSSHDIELTTSPAWDDQPDQPTSSPYANHWFFMGYAAPGYTKLSSVPNELPPDQLTDDGDPAHFSFEGPFHKLIWSENSPYGLLELKVIKDDQGRAYIPDPQPHLHNRAPIDEIGVLEPGKGYFLGFGHSGTYTFDGWDNWPQWQNDNVTPDPKGNQATISSGSHFSFNKYTHWSYPVYIDTVDLNECPMEAGDEIAVFDGDRCVGADCFDGEFPMLVTCWEDDKATPTEVDGYIDGNEMTFIWYDQSENAEIEFVPPPMTASKEEDDRVAPQYAGFGMGLYAYRSFMDGTSDATYLPKTFSLKQNYPNPFNSTTVIPLELPQRSRVVIDLYDVCGRLVWTHNAGVQNAGWPIVHFNASNLASGVYFYRVTATGLERGGRYQDVGKMLLLK
ncbi:T9SS type A sorting domain-containing protein [bacterium]|nr:T9SS type A sorting domain-containing protein [bacterium]